MIPRAERRHENDEAIVSFEDDLAVGEWLHRMLIDAFGLETEAWAVERIRNAGRALQGKRAPRSRLIPEILWMAETNAFTAPGRYIYITRELLQRADSDDQVAFV